MSEAAEEHRVFWADEIADEIEARSPTEPILIKGGISPSGVPHLGNMNELLRGYFVAEVLRERGYEVRQVFTADDRDPLRSLPRLLADLDGTLVGLDQVDAAALGRNLGKPYTDIPDPFGCCDSYGAHFSRLIEDGATQLDIPVELISTTELYEGGRLDDPITTLLEDVDAARAVIATFQEKADDTYVPFNVICANCGIVTESVTAVDPAAGTVDYTCTDITAGNREIAGCGHEGTATIREGKLPWRFEWPAQWQVLGVDFEPFGKDHAEGSWPSGQEIARRLLGVTPPVPMVYEWFTLDGEPFSSSSGHVVVVDEVLELIEPAVLKYFFSKDPKRARDFSIERIDLLVDEFDRFERMYFGEEPDADPAERRRADRVYPFLVEEIDSDRIRLPYTFAAVLGMTEDVTVREEIARREGHIPQTATPDAVEVALRRVERARAWARRTDNDYNYELKRTTRPDVPIDDATGDALDEVADVVADGGDGEAIQGAIYEAARRHDLPIGDLFTTGYRLFLDRDEGPKLGPFLSKLDRGFVVERLRRQA